MPYCCINRAKREVMKRVDRSPDFAHRNMKVKKVPVVITLVTLFAVVYHMSPFIGVPDNAIIIMFILSPFLVLYMAYVILKYGTPSKYTFDDRFYEDKE